MKSGTRDSAEGKWHEAKGKVKEMAGDLADDPSLEAEGTREKIAGKLQDKVGRLKRKLGK